MSSPRLHHLRALYDSNVYLLSVAGPLMLPVSSVVVFAGCALWQNRKEASGPMSLEELAARIGKTPSAISAHMRYLSDNYRHGKEGMGLVRTYENRHNSRKKCFELTAKGEAVAAHLRYLYHRPAGDL